MNKLSIATLVMMVLCAASALATVTVNYQFNVNSVDIAAYNCLDAACATVGPFSGSFPDGAHTSNGNIRISFPTSLASANGYALYYVSPALVPMVYRATWYGEGTTSFPITFEQIPMCRSVIDTFTVTNDAHANVPLVVHTSASLDAITRSAFALTHIGVEYVPPQYKDYYYSADTRVTLTIRDANGVVVDQQHQDFTAANGDPLFASDSRPVDFTWTPAVDGSYNATVTTTVLDDQCAAQEPQSASSAFSVLPALPRNMCYTILNGLAATPFVATVNESVTLDFTKISNHANNFAFNDPRFVLTPVPTQITWQTQGPSSASGSFLAGANPEAVNPYGLSFSFTPTAQGMYQVIVTGIASSPLCAGLQNVPNTVTLNIFAHEPQRYTIHFVVVDGQTGNRLQGATIVIAGQTLVTDVNGEATTLPLLPGDYVYSVSAPGFVTATGTAHLVDTDLDIFIALQRGVNPGNQFNAHFHVYDANTLANIQGAIVTSAGQSGLTDVNGRFDIVNLVNGIYPWNVAAAGCLPAAGAFTINNADAQVEVPLVCGPNVGPWNITFHVYDGDTGANLPGATVTVDARPSQMTDVFGRTVFNWFANGNYPWTVALAGYTGAAGTVTVNNANVLVEVPLYSGHGCVQHRITFTVKDTYGRLVQHARVTVAGGSLFTDVNGVVTFLRCDGTYDWHVQADGYDSANGLVTVAGSDVNIVVTLAGEGPNGPEGDNTQLGIYVGSIRLPDIDGNDGQVPILITFKNEGNVDLDGIKVTAISTELGLRGVVGSFDLHQGDQVTARVLLDLDGLTLKPGLYPIRLTISNDDTDRVVYRDLEVLA
jgi:hypothetical protein